MSTRNPFSQEHMDRLAQPLSEENSEIVRELVRHGDFIDVRNAISSAAGVTLDRAERATIAVLARLNKMEYWRVNNLLREGDHAASEIQRL